MEIASASAWASFPAGIGLVLGGGFLGFGGDADPGRLALGLAHRLDQGDLLGPFGLGHLAGGRDGLGRLGRLGAGQIGGGTSTAFLFGFLLDDDLALLLGHLQFALLGDLGLADLAFAGDLGGAHLFFPGDPGLFGGAHAFLAAGGDFRALGGLHGLDLLDLGDRGALFLLLDGEFLTLRFHRGAAHGDLGLGVDLGALLLGLGDDLRQLAHPHGVEGVVLVERLERRLIERRERDRFKAEAVLGQVFGDGILHLLHEIRPVFVQLVHGHARGHGTQAVDQLALDHLA